MQPAQTLQESACGVRLSFTWMGVKKTLTPSEKTKAADVFGAAVNTLSASKKLIDTGHEAMKALSSIKTRIINLWKSCTLPYVEDGVRLIRKSDVEEFAKSMTDLKAELDAAVLKLNEAYPGLRQQQASKLGALFNPADYPPTVIGLFGVEYDFPSLDPPDWMKTTNPALYEQERKRIAAKFEEAVHLAEQQFAVELANLVEHLANSLGEKEDGKKMIFKDSTVSNLSEFFDKFQHLNIGSNEKLDELVQNAKALVAGKDVKEFRNDEQLRADTKAGMAQIAALLDEQIIQQPRRKITKKKPSPAEPDPTPVVSEQPVAAAVETDDF